MPRASSLCCICVLVFGCSFHIIAQTKQTPRSALPDSPDMVSKTTSDGNSGLQDPSSSSSLTSQQSDASPLLAEQQTHRPNASSASFLTFVQSARARYFLHNRQRKNSSRPPRTPSTTPHSSYPPCWQAIRWLRARPRSSTKESPAMAAISGTVGWISPARTTQFSS
jgi:hypothetical protein